MSKFAKFMKANKVVKENEKHAVTKSLCDESGKPLLWEFRHISSKENEDLRENCMMEVQVTGKPGVYRQKFRSGEYLKKWWRLLLFILIYMMRNYRTPME